MAVGRGICGVILRSGSRFVRSGDLDDAVCTPQHPPFTGTVFGALSRLEGLRSSVNTFNWDK